jgi:glycine/D-amino acid oxidase-like deaminating enzyme
MGVTAAYLLKRIGLTVVLIERDRCGGADTGHTTAHLTSVTDLRPSDLVNRFGQEGAQSVWRAGEFAIQSINEFLTAEGIRCDFAWIPGFLHASLTEPSRDEVHSLQADAKAVADFGGSATFRRLRTLGGAPWREVREPGKAASAQVPLRAAADDSGKAGPTSSRRRPARRSRMTRPSSRRTVMRSIRAT